MSDPQTTLRFVLGGIGRILALFAIIGGMSFGMIVGIDYSAKHFKGPKPDPVWVQQQDKACHAKCVADWEVEP